MAEPSLEQELTKRARRNRENKNFVDRYNTLKEYVNHSYYPYIRDKCPYFPDHGEGHINSVIRASSLLLGNCFGGAANRQDLSSLDIFLLLTAIIWHDVGMVIRREEHAKNVKPMIDEVRKLAFQDVTEQRFVEEMVRAHSGGDTLHMLKTEEHYGRYTVFPRALAAILRFADEVSEDRTRISLPVLDRGIVPEDQQIFWCYANSIAASRPEPARSRVVITAEFQVDEVVQKYRAPSDSGSITLIEYFVRRIEKMNNERAYCSAHFSRYASIRSILLRIRLFEDTDGVAGYDNEYELGDRGIPEIPIYDEFFNTLPQWQPSRIREVLAT